MIGVGAPLLLLLHAHGAELLCGGRVRRRRHVHRRVRADEPPRLLLLDGLPRSTAAGLLVGSLFATWLCSTSWGASIPSSWPSWGWRIPFWLAGPLGYITHYIREHLEDSPVYAQMQAELAGEGLERARTSPCAPCSGSTSGVLAISVRRVRAERGGLRRGADVLRRTTLEATLNYDPASGVHHHALSCWWCTSGSSSLSGLHLRPVWGARRCSSRRAAGFVVLHHPGVHGC